MAQFKKGQKVEAFPGGQEGFIGFVVDGPNDDGKHHVQVGADKHWLAYRETDAAEDKGDTFRLLG